MIELRDDELDELIKYRNGLNILINRLEQVRYEKERIWRSTT